MKKFFQISRVEFALILVVFLVAWASRGLYVRHIYTPPYSDMEHYHKIACSLIKGEGFSSDGRPTAYRPPVYPFFIAGVYLITGPSPESVRNVQALLGALNCVLLFFIARHLFRKSPIQSAKLFNTDLSIFTAFIAAMILALFDEWIFSTGQLLTEIVYTFLFSLLLIVFIVIAQIPLERKKQRLYALAGLGVLSALVALTRPVAFFSAIPMGIVLIYRWNPKPRTVKTISKFAGVFLAGILVLCLPWIIRNTIQFGPMLGLTTNTGVNFYIGHNPYFGYWSTGDKQGIRALRDWTEVEENQMFLQVGLRYAVTHPGATVTNTARKCFFLFGEPWRPWPRKGQTWLDVWNPWSKRHIAPFKPWPWNGESRQVPPDGFYPFPLIVWDLPFILLVLIGLGWAIYDRCPWRWLYWAMGGQVVAYLVFFARARFRMPLGLLFAIMAAYTLARLASVLLNRYSKTTQSPS